MNEAPPPPPPPPCGSPLDIFKNEVPLCYFRPFFFLPKGSLASEKNNVISFHFRKHLIILNKFKHYICKAQTNGS